MRENKSRRNHVYIGYEDSYSGEFLMKKFVRKSKKDVCSGQVISIKTEDIPGGEQMVNSNGQQEHSVGPTPLIYTCYALPEESLAGIQQIQKRKAYVRSILSSAESSSIQLTEVDPVQRLCHFHIWAHGKTGLDTLIIVQKLKKCDPADTFAPFLEITSAETDDDLNKTGDRDHIGQPDPSIKINEPVLSTSTFKLTETSGFEDGRKHISRKDEDPHLQQIVAALPDRRSYPIEGMDDSKQALETFNGSVRGMDGHSLLKLIEHLSGESPGMSTKDVYLNTENAAEFPFVKYQYRMATKMISEKVILMLLLPEDKGVNSSSEFIAHLRQLKAYCSDPEDPRLFEDFYHFKKYRNDRSKKWKKPFEFEEKPTKSEEDEKEALQLLDTQTHKSSEEILTGKELPKLSGENQQELGQSSKGPHQFFNTLHDSSGGDYTSEVDLESDGTTEDGNDIDFVNEAIGGRQVPQGGSGSGQGASHQNNEEFTLSRNRNRLFLDYWNLPFKENSEKCLCSALDAQDVNSDAAPSTMFLLDYSRSIDGNCLNEMKSRVEEILEEAGSKHTDTDVSETYGVAVFGRDTKIIQPPTKDLRSVLEAIDQTGPPAGRSPLGLGLILSTCVWFADRGTGGTFWLYGRKVKPRIILISDMRPNKTVQDDTEDADDPDSFEPMRFVKKELVTIAKTLKRLGIPIFGVPLGNCNEVLGHINGVIDISGGSIMETGRACMKRLGRMTWLWMIACTVASAMEEDGNDMISMINVYTGENTQDVKTITRMIEDMIDREKKEGDIKRLIKDTGEPGEELRTDHDFLIGQRVLLQHEYGQQRGTVIGHLPERKLLIIWDMDTEMDPDVQEMSRLRKINTPRNCEDNPDEKHLPGSSVKKVIANSAADQQLLSSDVGIVLTSSTIQRNVVYVLWNFGSENAYICRHSHVEISRYIVKGRHDNSDYFWLYCKDNHWRPFPANISEEIEESHNKNNRTHVIRAMYSRGYRVVFQHWSMRETTNQCSHPSWPVHREKKHIDGSVT